MVGANKAINDYYRRQENSARERRSDRYKELKLLAENKQQKIEPGFRYGIIELTTKCQLACPGCYMVRRNALNKGEMTLDQAVHVLDLCRGYRGSDLETMDLLGGEPLLWPYLKEYISILLERGITPWIFTNMIAVTPSLADWLLEREVHITGKLNINPDDIKCHLDDSEQLQLQAKMIGRSTSVASDLLWAIKILLDAGYRDPLFRLQNLIRRGNITQVPTYYHWCLRNDIGTDLELMGSGEQVDDQYWQVAPRPKEIAKMIEEIQKIRQYFNLQPAEVLMPHIFGSCPFYDRGLYFAVDGHIRACSNSTVRLGHVDDDNAIEAALHSPVICNRHKLNQSNVGEPCRSCDRWDKCRGGCRATVEGTGNPFGGYPLCPVPYLR